MFHAHLSPHLMLYVAAALLLTTAGLYAIVNRNGASPRQAAEAKAAIGGEGAFSLVFARRYIKLIVALLIVLNIVNTVGEYILSHMEVAHAAEAVAADPSFDRNAYIGAFYGSCFLWVNIAALVLQMLVAPRLVKRFGLAGALFALPLMVTAMTPFSHREVVGVSPAAPAKDASITTGARARTCGVVHNTMDRRLTRSEAWTRAQ